MPELPLPVITTALARLFNGRLRPGPSGIMSADAARNGGSCTTGTGANSFAEKMHKGRMMTTLVALRRLVISQWGRRLETEPWSERLLREGGL